MRQPIEPLKVYTLEEAQRLLVLSKSTFRLLLERGQIKGRKAGRVWRFLGADLIKFFEDSSTPGTAEPR